MTFLWSGKLYYVSQTEAETKKKSINNHKQIGEFAFDRHIKIFFTYTTHGLLEDGPTRCSGPISTGHDIDRARYRQGPISTRPDIDRARYRQGPTSTRPDCLFSTSESMIAIREIIVCLTCSLFGPLPAHCRVCGVSSYAIACISIQVLKAFLLRQFGGNPVPTL